MVPHPDWMLSAITYGILKLPHNPSYSCVICLIQCVNCWMFCFGDREGLWLQSVLVWLLQVLQVRTVWYKMSLQRSFYVDVQYSFSGFCLLSLTIAKIVTCYSAHCLIIFTFTLFSERSFIYRLLLCFVWFETVSCGFCLIHRPLCIPAVEASWTSLLWNCQEDAHISE